MTTQPARTWLGVLLASIAATAWGLSGVAASTLFKYYPQFDPLWLTQIRMIIAGAIMLALSGLRHQKPFAIWHQRHSTLQVIAYGLFGLIPVQFFYFLAVQAGNASIATILQYLCPFVIVLYNVVRFRQLPQRSEVIGIIVAFMGTFLLVTNGHFGDIAISPLVLFWGLLSAVGAATIALIPRDIMPEFGSLNTTGWGLLVAGLAMNTYHSAWLRPRHIPWQAFLLISAIILVGTVFALVLFNMSFQYIKPTTASLLDAFEPLSATIFSILLLGVPLTRYDLFGGALIILAVALLTVDVRRYLRRLRH